MEETSFSAGRIAAPSDKIRVSPYSSIRRMITIAIRYIFFLANCAKTSYRIVRRGDRRNWSNSYSSSGENSLTQGLFFRRLPSWRVRWFVRSATEKGMSLERAAKWFAANARAGGNVFSSRAIGVKNRNLRKFERIVNP
jgi:hypothetical protein